MTDNNSTRIPPQALEAEMAVIGGAMQDVHAAEVLISLQDSYFYKEAHKQIFRAIKILIENNIVADLVTVSKKLEDLQVLEECGGHYYLTELLERVPSTANIDYYCNILRETGVRRQAIQLFTENITRLYSDPSTDVSTVLTEVLDRTDLLTRGIGQNVEIISPETIRKKDHEIMTERISNPKKFIRVGYSSVDKLLPFGLIKPGVSLLAARPKMGKTTTAMNIVYNTLEAGHAVIGWVPEMNNVRTIDLFASIDSKLTTDKFFIRESILTPQVKTARLSFSKKWKETWDFRIFDKLPLSSTECFQTIANMIHQKPCDLLVLDMAIYFTEVLVEKEPARKSYLVGMILQKAIAFARKYEIHILFVWQLGKQIEQRRGKSKLPQLGDVAISDSLVQGVDQIFMINRPKYYDDSLVDDILEFYIKAQRGGGEVGKVEMHMPEGNRLLELYNQLEDIMNDDPLF